jgi:hypothetical protein
MIFDCRLTIFDLRFEVEIIYQFNFLNLNIN